VDLPVEGLDGGGLSAGRVKETRITLRMLLLVGGLGFFGPLCIDAYIPSLPTIGRDLHAGASVVQASITACLFGLGGGQLLVGPVSDRLGRRRPLAVGLLTFILASAGCAVAQNVVMLIVLRFVQGLGAAAGLVTARAIVRDHYSGATASRFFSTLILVTGLGPILAPQMGALLLGFGSWRWVFVSFVVLGGALIVVMAFALPETLPVHLRHRGGLLVTVRVFREVLTHRRFVGSALTCAFGLGTLFAYISGSSYVFENVYGLSPQVFSLVFAANAVGMVLGAQVNRRLIGRFSPVALLTIGAMLLASAAIALLVVVATGWLGLGGVIALTFLILASFGLIGPNSQALALNDFGHAAGSAAAVLGVTQFAVGGIVAPLVGLGGTHTALPMAIVMATLGIACVAVRFALLRSDPLTPTALARKILQPPGVVAHIDVPQPARIAGTTD